MRKRVLSSRERGPADGSIVLTLTGGWTGLRLAGTLVLQEEHPGLLWVRVLDRNHRLLYDWYACCDCWYARCNRWYSRCNRLVCVCSGWYARCDVWYVCRIAGTRCAIGWYAR